MASGDSPTFAELVKRSNQQEEHDEDEIVQNFDKLQLQERTNLSCRICLLHNALVNINTVISPELFSITMSVDKQLYQVPIMTMIEEISGEKVSVDDGFPQFICIHCLGYLQHAYEIRLRIRESNSNLRAIAEVISEDSFMLEKKFLKPDQTSVNQREVELIKEEEDEERHLLSIFEGHNVKIQTKPKPRRQQLSEYKCPSCRLRIFSIDLLAEHMKRCEVHILEVFYMQFYHLYWHKETAKINPLEYALRACKLVFDVKKKLDIYVQINSIDVDGITTNPLPTTFAHPNLDSRWNSPDNGYLSGNAASSSKKNNGNYLK